MIVGRCVRQALRQSVTALIRCRCSAFPIRRNHETKAYAAMSVSPSGRDTVSQAEPAAAQTAPTSPAPPDDVRFRVACLQLNCTDDVERNIAMGRDLVAAARRDGADFILTPENTGIMAARQEASVGKAQPEDEHVVIRAYREYDDRLLELGDIRTRFWHVRSTHWVFCRHDHHFVLQYGFWYFSMAREHQCWILLGSVGVRVPDDERIANRSLLFSPHGEIVARYDKIHLFDVALGAGETYSESTRCRPGHQAVLAQLPWGGLGMSVCYDVRFPALYRLLARAGAAFLSVPAAFTRPTGEAHWETLLRARAIENGCYVFAPAQCGEHPGGRRTYGHALIVDPWGRVLADAGDAVGFVRADVRLAEVWSARQRLPVLQHERPFELVRMGL